MAVSLKIELVIFLEEAGVSQERNKNNGWTKIKETFNAVVIWRVGRMKRIRIENYRLLVNTSRRRWDVGYRTR